MGKLKKGILFVVLLLLSLESLLAREKFALVLSGGGARGIAHVPVLQELERRGIVPDLIVGTSMGALIGGFYCAGWSADEIETLLLESDIVEKIKTVNNLTGELTLVSPDSLVISNIVAMQFGSDGIGAANGLIDDQNIDAFIRENLIKVLDVDDFDDLSVPFRAIGTNITDGKEIIFDSGSLYTALRASMSLPIIFSPVKLDDNTYVMDGGLVNNLPVDVARDLGADIVLAVDVNDALNSNRSIDSNQMETLTGTISAFSLSLNMINSVPQYENADWVLVPDVMEYSTLDFKDTEGILEKGRHCVYENSEIFDKLEKRLKGESNEYVLYSDIEPAVIKQIDRAGIEGFDSLLNEYIGKSFDYENTSQFELLLLRIKTQKRLKDITYDFKDGVITLKPTYYNNLEGVFALGITGDFGMIYDGINGPYFSIIPNISIGLQYHLTATAAISAAMIYHDTLTFETRFSVPVMENLYFYAGIDFDYLDLSLISMPRKYGHAIRNDIGASGNTGIFYNTGSTLVAEGSIGFEYTHIAGIQDPVDLEYDYPFSNHGYGYFSTSVSYNTLDRNNAILNGIKSKIVFDLGMEFNFDDNKGSRGHEIDFAYSFKSDTELVFGYSAGNFKGISEVEIDTIRKNPYLSKAYVATKTGIPTSDYIYGMIGVRGQFPNSSIYFDIAPFVEFFNKLSTTHEYWNTNRNNIPFSLLNDYTLGIKVGLGVSTGIGTIFMDFHFGASDKFRCAMLFGIR